MRLRTLVCCSASIAALTFGAGPAWAQPAAQPQPPAEEGSEGGESAQDEPSDSTSTNQEGEETIVVTGLRRSLQSARNIRRNSEQIVDAVVAEDIGRLPDIAVSDTAARIPGVQVERGGGEAGRVLVRGLPDFTTTYNGREIFTAETRSVALQDFPSGMIGAIEVFKTSTANLIEPGLAGLVNVRSRRPFDFDGFEIAGSAWGLYTYQADTVTPNGNLLLTNRWEAPDGSQIGGLIGFSYTRLRYLDSTRENTDFVAGGGPNGTRFTDIQRIFYGSGDRERPSINGAFQYRHPNGFDFYIEGLWQGFRNRVSDRMLAVPLWGGSGFSNFQTQEGRPDLLESGTVTNPFRPDGFQGGTFNRTDTFQFAVGGSYDAGSLRVSADLARTFSTFTGSTASVDYAFANRQTVTFDTDVEEEDGGAEFSFANFDAANPANYVYRGFYEEAQESRGDDWQARLDFDYETGMSAIPEIEFGVRFTDRDAHREFGNRYFGNAPVEDQRIPFSRVPLLYELFQPGFRGSSVQPFRTFLSPTYESIRRGIPALRQFTRDIGGTHFTLTDPAPDPLQTWDANEQTYAGYGQIRYDVDFGGVRIDGNIGVRVVRTNVHLTGTQLIFPADPDGGGPLPAPPGVLTAVDVDREFTDVLPNVNARIQFTPQLQMRLAYTHTRTRPSFTDLRPSATIDRPPECLNQVPIPEGCVQTGSGGNPFLDRLTSRNFDASIEYYFTRAGFASVSVFHRDMEGFIENTTGQGFTTTGDPLRFTGPINSGEGSIRGFEAQVTTFFDFDFVPTFLRSFGAQANVTHIDARADFVYNGQSVNRNLLGVSDWSYNLAAFYENGPLAARISYNWRSDYLATFVNRDAFFNTEGPGGSQRPQGHLYTERANPVSRLDFSASYRLFENLTIFGDWTNILGDPFTSTLTRTDPNGTQSTFPRFVRFEESTVSLGIRFRF